MQRLEGESEQAEDLGETPAALELRQDAGTALLRRSEGLGGINGGRELARLGISENLAIGATPKGVKLADVIDTFAPDGVRNILMVVQDNIRVAMLGIADRAVLSMARGIEGWTAEWQREHRRLSGLSAWPEPAPRRRPVYLPEPEPAAEQIEVVQISEHDWREAITLALKEGKATPKQVAEHLRQLTGRLSRMPSQEELEVIYATYQRMKSRGYSPDAIARKLNISRATLYRRIKDFETFGKQ